MSALPSERVREPRPSGRRGELHAVNFAAKRASRDLCRFAVSFLITPLAATRSSTDTAARTAVSASARLRDWRTDLSAERIRVRSARLRRRDFSLVMTRLAADL